MLLLKHLMDGEEYAYPSGEHILSLLLVEFVLFGCGVVYCRPLFVTSLFLLEIVLTVFFSIHGYWVTL
jgi:hypothetical protein